MNKYIFILFVLILPLAASDFSRKTDLFEKYLNKEQGLQIREKRQFFFIIDVKGCTTCKTIDFDFLGTLSKREDVIIIISYARRGNLPHNIKDIIKKNNVFLDKGNYFNWNITPLTDGFIVTENKEIIKIHELQFWTSKTVNDLLNKYE